MKHIVIEASSKEVCVRCYDTGEVISPKELSSSPNLLKIIRTCFKQYKEANHCNSDNYLDMDRLEQIGIGLAVRIKKDIPELNVHYQSDTLMIEIAMVPENILY